MNTDTESRVRAALHATASELRQEDLRRPTFPSAAHRHWRSAPLIAAAAVAVVVVGIAIGIWVTRPDRTAQATAGVAISTSEVTVDGLRIPVPSGWQAIEQSAQNNRVQLCLGPETPTAMTNDCSNGVTIKIARPQGDGTFDQLPGDGPRRACSPAVGGTTTTITTTPADIGGRQAERWSITCGTGPVISTFWRMSDMSFTMQSPFDGSLQGQTAELAAAIDSSAWALKPAAPAESSAALSPTG